MFPGIRFVTTFLAALPFLLIHASRASAGPLCLNRFGLQNCAEGQAQLSIADVDNDGDLELLVSNIGSSGLDGFRYLKDGFIPTDVRSIYVVADFPTLQPGDAVFHEAIGTLAGVPDQVLGSGNWTYTLTQAQFVFDPPPAGAISYTTEVYDNGTLVASIPSAGPPEVILTMIDPFDGDHRLPWGFAVDPGASTLKWDYSCEGCPGFPNTITIIDDVGNVHTAVGDRLLIIAIIASLPDSIDAMRIRYAPASTDPPPWFAIQDEAALLTDGHAIIYGQEHTPLGLATLDIDDDCDGAIGPNPPVLHVCNIGSSGQDGATLHWDDGSGGTVNVDFFDVFVDLPPNAAVPIGASLDLVARKKPHAGKPSPPIASLHTEKSDLCLWWVETADYSPIGAATMTVEIYNAGTLVLTQAGYAGPGVRTGRPPSPVLFDHRCRYYPDCDEMIALGFPPGTEIELLGVGPVVAGDEVRFIAENPTLPGGPIAGVDLTATDMPPFSIRAEAAGLLGDCNGDGVFDVGDVPYFVINVVDDNVPPKADLLRCDTNIDGVCDGADIQSFIDLLLMP